MKKLFLICALICVGQLYCMEPSVAKTVSQGSTSYGGRDRKRRSGSALYSSEMLPEIKQQILNAALASSYNDYEAINAIKKFSILHGVQFDDPQVLIEFENLLSEKFPKASKVTIRERLNRQYYLLNATLAMRIYWNSPIELIVLAISQGADVNCYDHGFNNTPLMLAVLTARVEVVELLLNSGANPFFKQPYNGMTALDIVQNFLARGK